MRTWHLAKEAGLHGAVDVHGALEPRLVPRLLAHLQPDETEHASIITAVKAALSAYVQTPPTPSHQWGTQIHRKWIVKKEHQTKQMRNGAAIFIANAEGKHRGQGESAGPAPNQPRALY
jgi:hypothetical protein